MSFEAVSWALEQPFGGAKKIILLGIASHADRHGRNAWPSIDTLSMYAHIDPRSVKRVIAELVAGGFLEREIGAGGTRNTRDSSRPNLYHLNIDLNPREVVPRGDTQVTPGVTPRSPPGGDTQVTRTPIEPPLEQTPLPPTGGASALPSGFKAVFAEYPRQTDEAKALKAWSDLNPSEALQGTMVAAIRAWRKTDEWRRKNGQFVPKFVNWLRHQRWLDVPGIAEPPASPRAVKPVPPEPPPVPMPPDVRAKSAAILRAAGRVPKHEEAMA